jgi:apolipoprotein D and lipocalin family protein
MKMIVLLAIVSAVGVMGCRSPRSSVDLTPTAHVDLARYMGRWYEIARFDHWFERGLSQAQARYAMREDGGIDVVNTAYREEKMKTSAGRGKLTNRSGLLRVSFFWPFYADYRILWLDRDYRYALVGGGTADYLWILSRTPTIDLSVRKTILDEAVRRGYDVRKLLWVEQR